ncbi:MAG: tetratricopeptide repeat protein [Bacteroidia bacterium]|nr:tetratricopeptide repeat protein [Bacteroidia bacterium]
MNRQRLVVLIMLCGVGFLSVYCTDKKEPVNVYLNHNDTVKYVGKEQCKACHGQIYNTFIETGMGRSFEPASRKKSSAEFGTHKPVYDSVNNFYYYPFWKNDSMYIEEFRLKGNDTIYKRIQKVDYIIGSGQHTNSHLTNTNGFLYQLPLTWYAQQRKWDLPPGFENGRNVRFNRAIGFECMSCHNAMPEIAEGSVNKFTNIPDGIDCERCHGPGELHLKEKLAGHIIDTSTQIDYTIVNPRKLPWQKQIDLCQRCHLQGNAVLKEGKKFKDFKPGMNLSDVVDVYMPKYNGRDDEFIMASHAQRLQQSKCFIESNKYTKKKEGSNFETMNLTCVTCHNPHVSVKVTGNKIFNNACIKCHQGIDDCKESKAILIKANNNCISCHMPRSGSIDIPHVTVHDHKIKKPVDLKKIEAIKTFAGIYCVNNTKNDAESKAAAYLNYYEKFEGEAVSVVSALVYINQIKKGSNFNVLKIHYLYLKNNYEAIIKLAGEIDLKTQNDPWLCYRIGQAYQNLNMFDEADIAYKYAIQLAPDNLDFCNKRSTVYIQQHKFAEAINLLESNLKKQPEQEVAWVNLGFAYLNLQNKNKAMKCYNRALSLNPDFGQALMNRAALFNLLGQKQKAVIDLKHILLFEPDNTVVKKLLQALAGPAL